MTASGGLSHLESTNGEINGLVERPDPRLLISSCLGELKRASTPPRSQTQAAAAGGECCTYRVSLEACQLARAAELPMQSDAGPALPHATHARLQMPRGGCPRHSWGPGSAGTLFARRLRGRPSSAHGGSCVCSPRRPGLVSVPQASARPGPVAWAPAHAHCRSGPGSAVMHPGTGTHASGRNTRDSLNGARATRRPDRAARPTGPSFRAERHRRPGHAARQRPTCQATGRALSAGRSPSGPRDWSPGGTTRTAHAGARAARIPVRVIRRLLRAVARPGGLPTTLRGGDVSGGWGHCGVSPIRAVSQAAGTGTRTDGQAPDASRIGGRRYCQNAFARPRERGCGVGGDCVRAAARGRGQAGARERASARRARAGSGRRPHTR
jgi:hypothetical protein